jgi:SpoIVB peptidase S55
MSAANSGFPFMNVRMIAWPALVALTLVAWPSATARYMTVDEVRPGMTGVGRTVFQGDRVEEFAVHILGVMRSVNGPKRDLVLARLEGGPLARTGVIAGMSGSPVYVDGRLLGAVAYSLGQFPTEPLAGITPIDEILESAGARPGVAPTTPKTRLEFPLTEDRVLASLRDLFLRLERPFADSPNDIRFDGSGGDDTRRAAQLGALMRPIATPLALGGFSGPLGNSLSDMFRDVGFVPMADGVSAPDRPAQNQRASGGPPLEPGDSVGVNLIDGDFVMGATGTVTEVDGTRVFAFGHPFYNLGATALPMTRAYVYTVLPSLLSSMKISTTGETIGTFRQDRTAGIAGTLGQGPGMVPIRIALDTEQGLHKTLNFQVVNDPLLTPLLTYVSILNTLSSYERELGTATFTVTGTATIQGHGAVKFDDIFAGESPAVGAAASVVAPLTLLLGNDIEPVRIDGVDLHIVTSEHPRTATLDRIWVDAATIRAGTTVPLKMLLRTYRGEEITRTVPIDIPASASGSLSIQVSDGGRLAQAESLSLRTAQPKEVDQLVSLINQIKKNDRLYIRLLRQDAGAVINGQSFSALPPAVLAVMESDRNGGSFSPLRNATSGNWEVAIDRAVSGSRTLTITVQ